MLSCSPFGETSSKLKLSKLVSELSADFESECSVLKQTSAKIRDRGDVIKKKLEAAIRLPRRIEAFEKNSNFLPSWYFRTPSKFLSWGLYYKTLRITEKEKFKELFSP